MSKNYLLSKTIIVTGASSGIGKSIAQTLMQKYNCKILGIGRNLEKLQSVKDSSDKFKTLFIPYTMDVSNENEWITLKDYLQTNSVNPDVLINCAGYLPKFNKLTHYAVSDAKFTIDTNFYSVVYSVEHILPIIKQSKTPTIYNIGSSASLTTIAGTGIYSASKSALKSYTETLWLEETNVTVGLIMFGFVKTDIMRSQDIKSNEKTIVDKLSTSCKTATKKAVKAIANKKPRTIIGWDAHLMNILYKLFPKFSMKAIRFVLKKSKFKLFENVFTD